jgi:hypothetical protein
MTKKGRGAMTTIAGILIFVLDVWAIASIINSKVETGTKVLWILLVLLLPLIGFLVWYFAGPRPAKP